MPKKRYNYPIEIKIALLKYSVGLALTVYHYFKKKSIYFSKKQINLILSTQQNKKALAFASAFFWPALRESNPRPTESESGTLSN